MKEKEIIINKEVKKTFEEAERIMSALFQEATHHANDWKKFPSNPVRKEIETRLDHLLANSEPPLNDEKKLRYDFYAVKEMLIRVVDNLPGFLDEKGEVNEESLNLLINFLEGVEELKSGKKKLVTIPADKNFSCWLVSSSEKERLENELKAEKRKNDELREKLALFEAAEEDRKNQQKQASEKEQQTRDRIKTELERIGRSLASPSKLTAEELSNLWKKFQEMKNLLNGTAKEQILKKTIGHDEGKEVKENLKRTKLNLERRDAEQVIADALADKGAEKPVVVKREELLEEGYINYSQTLDGINDSDGIDKFKEEILQAIAEKRGQYWIQYRMMKNALSKGKKALTNNDLNKAKKAELILLTFRKSNHAVFLKFNRAGEVHILMAEIDSLSNQEIKEQEKTTAQIEQPPK